MGAANLGCLSLCKSKVADLSYKILFLIFIVIGAAG